MVISHLQIQNFKSTLLDAGCKPQIDSNSSIKMSLTKRALAAVSTKKYGITHVYTSQPNH